MKTQNFVKKNHTALALIAILTIASYIGCKKEKDAEKVIDATKLSAICNGKSIENAAVNNKAMTLSVSSEESDLPYNISLLSRKSNGDGTYTWIWSVTNPNPGNGKNGTVQDLSHWGISLGECAGLGDIVSAATSTDGIHWNSFSPSLKVDKSQDCYTAEVLKFDVGTNGSKTTYYQVTLNKNFTTEKRDAYYKSGANTGCGTFTICGIGCAEE